MVAQGMVQSREIFVFGRVYKTTHHVGNAPLAEVPDEIGSLHGGHARDQLRKSCFPRTDCIEVDGWIHGAQFLEVVPEMNSRDFPRQEAHDANVHVLGPVREGVV